MDLKGYRFLNKDNIQYIPESLREGMNELLFDFHTSDKPDLVHEMVCFLSDEIRKERLEFKET